MTNISLNVFGFIFIVISLIGCSSNNYEIESDLKLFSIDSSFFKEYNYLWFPSNYSDFDTSGFRVLTEKNDEININKNIYEPIKIGETYKLKLFTVDSLVSAKLLRWESLGDKSTYAIEPNVVIWERGKIMIKVYFSKDLKGRYVLKGKRKLQ